MTKNLTTSTNKNIENIAKRIANESPQLRDLSNEQLDIISKLVITQRLTNEMNDKVNIANIDYNVEKNIFIMSAGKTGSGDTKLAYRNALRELEKFTEKNNINILLMNYKEADDFIYSIPGSPNSKRLIIAAISSFYSYLERRYSSIKNPIRGTKARPIGKAVKKLEIPDEADMAIILNELPDLERMAVYIMAYRGLRVGALNKLKIWGTSYQSYSKGKEIYGEFSNDILFNIKSSNFLDKSPFSEYSTNAIKLRIYRQTMKLFNRGRIKSAYSAHDFRHYFAISEYKNDKDIYKLSKLLDHSNIAITETYLKGLKIAI